MGSKWGNLEQISAESWIGLAKRGLRRQTLFTHSSAKTIVCAMHSHSGLDIVIADDRRRIDTAEWRSKLDFDPFNPYPPPDVPILVRCVTCLEIYQSTEIRCFDGRWVCKHHPSCIGDGFGLNIYPADHAIFELVRRNGLYRGRRRRN